MIYVVSVVIAALVVFNLYASWKVLRDSFSTRTQKLMQLGFVWFVPIIGPVLTLSLISGTGHPTVDLAESRIMRGESYWSYTPDDCDPSDHSVSNDCD